MERKELSDELLECISGGEVILDNIKAVLSVIPLNKGFGATKNSFLESFDKSWLKYYDKYSTTLSMTDYEKIRKTIAEVFDYSDEELKNFINNLTEDYFK